MGSGSQSSTTTTKVEPSKEQAEITRAAMNYYMPGGQFKQKPVYNAQDWSGAAGQRVAGFNNDQMTAFQQTRDRAFAHDGAMQEAYGQTARGSGPTGTRFGLGRGWTGGRPASTSFPAPQAGAQGTSTGSGTQYSSPPPAPPGAPSGAAGGTPSTTAGNTGFNGAATGSATQVSTSPPPPPQPSAPFQSTSLSGGAASTGGTWIDGQGREGNLGYWQPNAPATGGGTGATPSTPATPGAPNLPEAPTYNEQTPYSATTGSNLPAFDPSLGNPQYDMGDPASFHDWNADTMQQYMNPFQQEVIDRGLTDIDRQNQRSQIRDNDAAVSAGAFGGSRHGVKNALTNEAYSKNSGDFVANMRQAGYDKARGEYDSDRQFGFNQLMANNALDSADADRAMRGGAQFGQLAKTGQDLDARGIDALSGVGGMLRGYDQSLKDTGYNEMMDAETWQAKLGQMMSGFAPPPAQTSTSSGNSGGGSIWGTIGGAAAQSIPWATIFASDENLKENVKTEDPNDSLAAIRKLKPVSYDYNDTGRAMGTPEGRRTGFMAQDLERATGKPNPKLGGYEMVDVGEQIGRLTHAVIALDNKVSKRKGAA